MNQTSLDSAAVDRNALRDALRGRSSSLVAVVSGKGGVGKTNVAVNLAVAAARLNARVLLFDGDLGLANVDVLLGMVPERNAGDVLCGEVGFADVIVTGPAGIHVVPAAAARVDLAAARPTELTKLMAQLVSAAVDYDLVLVDVAAGIGASVISLAAICDRALLLTTPEPTSLADAYSTFKVLGKFAPDLPVELLVNAVRDEAQAHEVHLKLEQVTNRFLGTGVPMCGFLPNDPRLADAVASQRAVVEAYPTSSSARKLVHLARLLLRDAAERSESAPGFPGGERWRKVAR